MRIFHFTCTLVVFLTLFSQSLKAAVQNDEKDLKFIFSNNLCVITKKELVESRDFIINTQDEKTIPLKKALTILQLRIFNNTDFKNVLCGIRFFIEQYNLVAVKDKFYRSNDKTQENMQAIVEEFSKIMEKTRTNPKYKLEFEKNVLNENELNFYYDFMGEYLDIFNTLDESFARKILANRIVKKGSRRTLDKEEWQKFFDLFYLKAVSPPKEVTEILKIVLKNPSVTNGFMTVYLKNVNDLAYNDLFKSFFESATTSSIINTFSDADTVNLVTLKDVLASKYFPEIFKCNYAREIITRKSSLLGKEAIAEISKIENKCVKEVYVDLAKFVTPLEGCPYIKFDKKDDKKNILSKMSNEFYKSWIDCRKSCAKGDKCTYVNSANVRYDFFNSKYFSDIKMYTELPMAQSQNIPYHTFLKYDAKLEGVCQENNVCGEKLSGCEDGEILQKIDSELSKAKLQDCKVDNDCYTVLTPLNCSELAVNVNPKPSITMPSQDGAIRPQYFTTSMNFMNQFGINVEHFPNSRISRILYQCGKNETIYSIGSCQNKPSEVTARNAKCVKNKCVVVKN